MRRALRYAAAVAALAMVPATPAVAAMMAQNATSFTFTDTQGSAGNAISVSVDNKLAGAADDEIIIDTALPFTGSAPFPCPAFSNVNTRFRCALGARESVVIAHSGDNATTVVTIAANRTEGELTVNVSGTGTATGYTFDASATTQGNVNLSATGGGAFTGGGGDDSLSGGPGADTLRGGPGDDSINPGNTAQGGIAEIIDGGEGSRDSVGFGALTVPVTVSLDGVANDSLATTPNARPLTITGIEDVSGGPGNDTIVGNDGSNILYGLGGNDTITGGGGIFDILRGGLGADTMNARGATPGFSDVACGAGADSATVDFIDLVDANCETVDRAAAPPAPPPPPPPPGAPGGPGGPGGGPGGDTTAPTITIAGVPSSLTRAKVLKGITVRVLTNERTRIVGELVGTATGARLKAVTNNLVLARKNLPLGTGARTMLLKPPAKLIAGARTLTVRVVATDAAGNSRTTTRRIRIR